MKIVHKISLANAMAIILIALTGFFALQNLNLILTKLRFAEIADDLNASFLEMRLSEKNYFLYGDQSALLAIRKKIDDSMATIDSVKPDIIKAIGNQNFDQLKTSLSEYLKVVEQVRINNLRNDETQTGVREAGQKLREFSSRITSLERNKVNEIIDHSKNELFSSLCFILLSAIAVSYLIFLNILRSMKQIKKVAHSISEGDFRKVETEIPDDELGSVILAINSMSQELENREEQIIQSKKLASIGILTAGVAHELGNPLNNISMIAQAYMEVYDSLSKEDRIDFMKKIEEETDRIKEIVKNLLDFSKPKKPNLKVCDMNAVVMRSLKLVRNMIHVCNIETHLNLEGGLPSVYIDEDQILEVLINLITNSVQAASPGEDLTIVTRPGEGEDQVEVVVKDTGKGIPPELLPNVFDPFFTTKGASGTGLGLFVSYGIIKNHQGDIRVSSEVGVGTSFTIELPVYRPEKEEQR